jgi:hypothetical protein
LPVVLNQVPQVAVKEQVSTEADLPSWVARDTALPGKLLLAAGSILFLLMPYFASLD